MKKLQSIALILVVLLLGACQSETVVDFPDENLEEALRDEIGKEDGELYASDFDDIESLNLSDNQIEELDGIEVIESLIEIDLENNEVESVEPLESLPNLEEATLTGNPVEEDAVATLEEAGVTVTFEQEQVGRPDGPGGYLWKVENEGTTVYLQGTVHLGVEEFYPLHEKIEQAYAESDVVVPEIDLNNLDFSEMNRLQSELGTFQDGTTLQDHVSEETYQELEDFFGEFGLDMAMIDTYQPWLVANMVSQFLTQGGEYTLGIDQYFLNKAASDDKEIIALETAEDQLSIFADLSMEFQVQMLEESLIEPEVYQEDLDQLLDIYKTGSVDDLLNSLFETDAAMSVEEEAYMEALNDNRNYAMAEKITEFLESGDDRTYFVIVGSLHLILEPHIGSILEEEGYEVEHIH